MNRWNGSHVLAASLALILCSGPLTGMAPAHHFPVVHSAPPGEPSNPAAEKPIEPAADPKTPAEN